MVATLVDSNVILDVVTENPEWFEWSAWALAKQANAGRLWLALVVVGGQCVFEILDPAEPRGDLRVDHRLTLTLLTRDPKRYRTYFPKLRIIAP